MARLPDGWVFIPMMKDAITIELKQMELVTCQHCKHGEPGACGYGVDCDGVWHEADWFCADGEEEDAEM